MIFFNLGKKKQREIPYAQIEAVAKRYGYCLNKITRLNEYMYVAELKGLNIKVLIDMNIEEIFFENPMR